MAKMLMTRKRRRRSEAMDWMLFVSDLSRFERWRQYLNTAKVGLGRVIQMGDQVTKYHIITIELNTVILIAGGPKNGCTLRLRTRLPTRPQEEGT